MIGRDINEIWDRIVAHEGQEFRQKGGKVFAYTIKGNVLNPSTTNQNVPKSEFEKSLARLPFEGPGDINDIRAPSYVYGILMDERISQGDW